MRKTKGTTFRIDPKEVARLDEFAAKLGTTRNRVMQLILKGLLAGIVVVDGEQKPK